MKIIQSNIQEWIENPASFQSQVIKWTTEQGCPSHATWKIHEEIDNEGSQPVEVAVIEVFLKVKLNISNIKIDPIHCTCHTRKAEDNIRSAVEEINENLIQQIDDTLSKI